MKRCICMNVGGTTFYVTGCPIHDGCPCGLRNCPGSGRADLGSARCLHPDDQRVTSKSWEGQMCGVCGTLLDERVKELLAELRVLGKAMFKVTAEGTPEEHDRAIEIAHEYHSLHAQNDCSLCHPPAGWLWSEPHEHSWWTEQQTGHTRCAYCPAHKEETP